MKNVKVNMILILKVNVNVEYLVGVVSQQTRRYPYKLMVRGSTPDGGIILIIVIILLSSDLRFFVQWFDGSICDCSAVQSAVYYRNLI